VRHFFAYIPAYGGLSKKGGVTMSEEEKGFVVHDRRSLNEEGDVKDQDVEAEQEEKGQEDVKDQPPKQEETASHPMPEPNFTALVFSLSSTALFHLGEIPDPQTGEKKKDIALAKHAIDTISMLQEKTAGNLTEEEKKFTESILADLRWRFIKAKT
jgi:hypothetical protein